MALVALAGQMVLWLIPSGQLNPRLLSRLKRLAESSLIDIPLTSQAGRAAMGKNGVPVDTLAAARRWINAAA